MPLIVEPKQSRFPCTATAAVQLYAQIGMGIQTHPDQALGEARLQRTHQPVAPFLGVAITLVTRLVGVTRSAVAGAMTVLAMVVDRAIEHTPGAVLDKAIGLRLRRISQREWTGQGEEKGGSGRHFRGVHKQDQDERRRRICAPSKGSMR
ncbi:hypothetical protein D3C84_774350 [compost metagenome]